MSTPPTHRRPKVQNHEILVMVMLTSHDLAELTRRSETTVHRWGRDGTEGFPKPIVSEGTKLRLWLTQEYNDWVERLKAQRDGAAVVLPMRRKRRGR